MQQMSPTFGTPNYQVRQMMRLFPYFQSSVKSNQGTIFIKDQQTNMKSCKLVEFYSRENLVLAGNDRMFNICKLNSQCEGEMG